MDKGAYQKLWAHWWVLPSISSAYLNGADHLLYGWEIPTHISFRSNMPNCVFAATEAPGDAIPSCEDIQ